MQTREWHWSPHLSSLCKESKRDDKLFFMVIGFHLKCRDLLASMLESILWSFKCPSLQKTLLLHTLRSRTSISKPGSSLLTLVSLACCFFAGIPTSTSETSPLAGKTAWPSTLSYTDTGKKRRMAESTLALQRKHSGPPTPSAQCLSSSFCFISSTPLVFCSSFFCSIFFYPFRPDLVDFGNLKGSNPTHNLQSAFNVAEQQLDVTKLLDPEGKWTPPPPTPTPGQRKLTCLWAWWKRINQKTSLAVTWPVLFHRCVHREPGREVHHHVRGGILPLLLQDEAARRRGQESRKGETRTMTSLFP